MESVVKMASRLEELSRNNTEINMEIDMEEIDTAADFAIFQAIQREIQPQNISLYRTVMSSIYHDIKRKIKNPTKCHDSSQYIEYCEKVASYSIDILMIFHQPKVEQLIMKIVMNPSIKLDLDIIKILYWEIQEIDRQDITSVPEARMRHFESLVIARDHYYDKIID